MQTVVLHHMSLPEGVPEWVHLCPAGNFTGIDGRGPYALKNPAAVIAASMGNNARLPIDEMHSTDKAAIIGGEARARGWIIDMEARPDGIWGKVEWTPTGKRLVEDKEYRGISPAFPLTPTREVTQILRASLTNLPNLTLHSLHTQETRMDLALVRAALGLPDTADEAACMAAMATGRQAVLTHTAQTAALATALGMAAETPVDRLVVGLQTQRAGAGKIGEMASKIVELQTQLSTMQQAGARGAAVAFVTAAIAAGKPILPIKDYFIDLHVQDAAKAEAAINAMPSINAGGVVVDTHGQQPAGGDGLTAEDEAVITKMGLDRTAYVEQKKKRGTA